MDSLWNDSDWMQLRILSLISSIARFVCAKMTVFLRLWSVLWLSSVPKVLSMSVSWSCTTSIPWWFSSTVEDCALSPTWRSHGGKLGEEHMLSLRVSCSKWCQRHNDFRHADACWAEVLWGTTGRHCQKSPQKGMHLPPNGTLSSCSLLQNRQTSVLTLLQATSGPGALMVWPGIQFPNSRGNKAAVDLCLYWCIAASILSFFLCIAPGLESVWVTCCSAAASLAVRNLFINNPLVTCDC